jgi:SAM-dependent methyltransferase
MSIGLSDAELYEQVLVPTLYEAWAAMLIERANLERGQAVIDIACGTGIVARIAREQVGLDARIVGLDPNPDLLAVARRIEPGIDWREAEVDWLAARDDASFDAAFCNQGIQFVRDKGSAIKAMRRVLRPGGRAAASIWRALGENGVFGDIEVIAERIVGRIDDTRFGFGDPDALALLFVDANFHDVHVEQLSHRARFRGDPSVLARLNATTVVAMSRARTRPQTERATLVSAIAAASVNEIRRRFDGDAFSFPTTANIVTARA